jgi:hypothetical protein
MNISKTVYKVSDFLSWQRAKSLVLSPSFQRRPVWKPDAKSYLIDTIVRGLPMPIVFLREQTNLQTLEPIREVVDGQQRLRTVIAFVEPSTLTDFKDDIDNFRVRKIHNSEIADKSFIELSASIRKRILNYEFSVHILPSETEDREVLQIFARMNSTGVKLNEQELRNAAYYGVFKQLSYRLAYEQLERWRDWGIFSETDIARMSEVEETSDLIQLMLEGIHSKSQKDLNKIYAEYDDKFPAEDEVIRRFRLVMDKLDEQLGKNLRNTEFSRRPLAHTLFTFYYDLMFGLNSPLEKVAVKNVPAYTKFATMDASDRIAKGKVSEVLMKVLRGATASASSRKARLDFLKERFENAAK